MQEAQNLELLKEQMNRLENKKEENAKNAKSSAGKSSGKKSGKLRREISSVLNGDAFSRENLVSNLPFLFFLTFLLVAYIGYGYYAARTSKEIFKLETQKRELHSDMINEQANLNLVTMPSQIADSTLSAGLKPSLEPPVKIKVSPVEYRVNNE